MEGEEKYVTPNGHVIDLTYVDRKPLCRKDACAGRFGCGDQEGCYESSPAGGCHECHEPLFSSQPVLECLTRPTGEKVNWVVNIHADCYEPVKYNEVEVIDFGPDGPGNDDDGDWWPRPPDPSPHEESYGHAERSRHPVSQ